MSEIVPVRVVDADGQVHACNLTYEESQGGYKISLRCSPDERGWSAFGTGLFEALCDLRSVTDELGLKICVNGARVDAFPSGLSLDMGGGQMLYMLRRRSRIERLLHLPLRRTGRLVDIFGPAPCDAIGSVEQQRHYYERWLVE